MFNDIEIFMSSYWIFLSKSLVRVEKMSWLVHVSMIVSYKREQLVLHHNITYMYMYHMGWVCFTKHSKLEFNMSWMEFLIFRAGMHTLNGGIGNALKIFIMWWKWKCYSWYAWLETAIWRRIIMSKCYAFISSISSLKDNNLREYLQYICTGCKCDTYWQEKRVCFRSQRAPHLYTTHTHRTEMTECLSQDVLMWSAAGGFIRPPPVGKDWWNPLTHFLQ